MLAYLSMLKEKVKKERNTFFSFVEGSLSLKPAKSLVTTTRGAAGQAPMVLGQAKGKNEMHSCYLYGKKGHLAKNCW